MATSYVLSVVGAIVILAIGFYAAGWAGRALGRTLDRLDRIDLTLRRFAASAVRYQVLVLTVLAVLAPSGSGNSSRSPAIPARSGR